MNSRRSFFKKLAAVVAAVSLAPEIAFRTALPIPCIQPDREYTCVLSEQDVRHYLHSKTLTVRVECPDRSFIIENFSS